MVIFCFSITLIIMKNYVGNCLRNCLQSNKLIETGSFVYEQRHNDPNQFHGSRMYILDKKSYKFCSWFHVLMFTSFKLYLKKLDCFCKLFSNK